MPGEWRPQLWGIDRLESSRELLDVARYLCDLSVERLVRSRQFIESSRMLQADQLRRSGSSTPQD